jgi:hypothetical protein
MVANLLLIVAVTTTVIANVSSWRIEKNKDPMTDEISCRGYQRNRGDVLLTDHILYISTKIAPNGITIRLGDEPAQTSLASSGEKIGRTIMLGTFHLDKIIEQKIKRVRYRVLTVLDSLVEGELDVTDIDKALEIIRSDKCKY